MGQKPATDDMPAWPDDEATGKNRQPAGAAAQQPAAVAGTVADAAAGGATAAAGHSPALPDAQQAEQALLLRLKAYEGPLDLLLELARKQKVDLTEISVLELAEQYIAVIEAAKRLHLELAAAWLVMAAWLAWLKSRLLLPAPPEEEEEAPDAEEMAQRLAFRLARLQAMREAGKALLQRPRLGVDVFARGAPEPVLVQDSPTYDHDLTDLLKAYAGIVRRKVAKRRYHIDPQPVWTIHEVREALEQTIGDLVEWAPLDEILANSLPDDGMRRSALASGFAASLELAREGRLELRQEASFAPLYARRRA